MAYQETDARGRLWQTKLTANDSTPIEGAEKLGAIRELGDGRQFRYIRMTGGAIALGQLVVAATKVTITDASATSSTIGPDGASTTLVTDPDADWTPDAYINWHFQVATALTGSTEPIKVVGNTKTTLTLEKTITTAMVADDDGEILAATAAGKISAVTDTHQVVIGVGIGTLTQNYYGWVQITGPAAVISHAITENEVACPGGAAGGEALDCDNDADNTPIGTTISTSGTDEYACVNLRLA